MLLSISRMAVGTAGYVAAHRDTQNDWRVNACSFRIPAAVGTTWVVNKDLGEKESVEGRTADQQLMLIAVSHTNIDGKYGLTRAPKHEQGFAERKPCQGLPSFDAFPFTGHGRFRSLLM